MKPTRITGDTWYISAPLNVGWCDGLMIDSGIDSQEGNQNASVLIDNGLKISALINTHGHPDHCGGNRGVMENRNISLYAVPKQIPFIENIEWVNSFMNGANAILPEPISRFFGSQSSKVDTIIPYGKQTLGNSSVEILNLEGHWLDCIGILTKDSVLFCGDAILGFEEIEKFKVPLYFDIEKSIQTLHELKQSNYNFYVPSHGNLTDDIISLADKNLHQIFTICQIVIDFCKEPATREAICKNLFEKLDVYACPYQWQVTHSTCGAILTYLCNKGKIVPIMKEYTIFYQSI